MSYLSKLKIVPLLLLCCCSNHLAGNSHRKADTPFVAPLNNDIRVEPSNWWTGMKHNRVEIMIHGKDISFFTVSLGGAQGVK
ncbi:MAG: cyclomaltodextrinase N-terminal domain-containing protein, partial [Bacteroidota bacterium]